MTQGVNIKKGLEEGRLKEISLEEVAKYQFDEKYKEEKKALLELVKEGRISAFWDNKLNTILYGVK